MAASALSHTLVSRDPEDHPIPHREAHILKVCETGDLDALSLVFQACNITAPATPITSHNADSHAIPQTHHMVAAAIRGNQKAMVQYIYSTFPTARIQGDELISALELGNLSIFEVVAQQSQSRYDVVLREFEDCETSLMKACRGQEPSIAFYLLDAGADPNYFGASGSLGAYSSPLANAVVEQDLALVERLVEKGAVVEDWHVHCAVEQNRANVVRYLANSREEGLNFQMHLVEASSLGHEEVVHVLERRIEGGVQSGAEKEHFGDRWHRMKEHLIEKVSSH
jgi:hypothetical protein